MSDVLSGNRGPSPLLFEKIDTLPFTDSQSRPAPAIIIRPGEDSGLSSVSITHPTHLLVPGQEDNRSVLPRLPPVDLISSSTIEHSPHVLKPAIPPDGFAIENAMTQTSSDKIPDAIMNRYSAYLRPPVEALRNRDGSIGGGLEDYEDININDIDRYGFFPQAIQRRQTSSSIDEARLRARSLRRRNTVARDTLKRASMNLGLYEPTDYLEPPRDDSHSTKKEVQRSQKWRTMASRQSPAAPFEFRLTSKLIDRVYKGIPDCWRSPAWQSFVSNWNKRTQEDETKDDLLYKYALYSTTPCELDEQIDLDVPRTVSGHVLFRRRHQGGQRLLFRILHAITLHLPDTGYVQGMASIAATLLCYFTEEEAFIMAVRMWKRRGLVDLYEPGFPRLIQAFERLKEKMRASEVGRHLLDIGCDPLAWATRWYLTIFHVSLPFHTQLRIWDLFMLHSPHNPLAQFEVLEATTLALIEGMENVLLGIEFDHAMRILTTPVEVKNDDRLMRAIRKKMRY